MKLKDKVSAKEKVLPFTDDQLKEIFLHKQYKTGKYKHPYHYWLPLMGVYTGARISELCQLYTEDVYPIDGLWVFDFNEKLDKNLKNDSSPRVIPIHSHLLDLGFIEYVTKVKKTGAKRIFPEIKIARDGYGHYPSNWFGRYKKTCGINEGRKKVFHSFRHNVNDFLKQRAIPESQIKAIVGHKDESVTTGLYGKAYEPKVLVPIVEMLNFNIDVLPYKHLLK
jgi:integrase